MRQRRLTLSGAAVALLTALTLSACGSSGRHHAAPRTPDDIVLAATRAIDAVHTVRVTGAIPVGGAAHTIRLDLHLVSGVGATGSMSENGVRFRLITVGGSAYINGSPAFWRQYGGAAAVARLRGRWLRAPAASGRFASLASLTDVHRLLAALLGGHGPLTEGAPSTVNGQRVIALHDTSKDGTLYAAAGNPPYPIRIANSGSEGGSLNFGDFNAKIALTPPRRSIDVASLTR